jgi:DNA repair protein SbcC/Rad50
MFNSFLKPKWQHKSIEIRQQAVSELDPIEDEKSIIEVAQSDDSDAIRAIAIRKLNKPSQLLQLIKNNQGEARDAAIDVYCHLSQSPATLMELIDVFADDTEAKFALLNSIEDPDLAAQVLEYFETEEALIEVVVNVKKLDVKKEALSRIDSESSLKKLKKLVTDKVVSQTIRERLKHFKQMKQKEQAQIESLQKLTEAMQRLASIEETPDIAQFTHLIESFEGIDSFAKIDYVDPFEAAKNIVSDRVSKNASDLQSLKQLQVAAKKKSLICDQLNTMIDELKQDAFDGEAHQIHLELEIIQSDWLDIADIDDKKIEESFNQNFDTLKNYANKLASVEKIQIEDDSDSPKDSELPVEITWRELESRIKYYESQVARIMWQKGFKKPAKLRKLETALYAVQQQKRTLQQKQKEQVKQIDKQIRDLQSKIKTKQLKAANKLHNYLLNKVNELTESHRDATLMRLNKIAENLAELKDWHQFATSPKREEIVEQMKALQSKKMDPEARMKQIRALQDEWKLLSAADFEQDQELWDEFKQASDKAFEPCAAYFAEQDIIRNDNRRQKQELLGQISNFYQGCDWTSVEWKQLDKIIRQARFEWNAIHNIPFKEAKAMNSEFESLMGKLLAKLNFERDKNLKAREDVLTKMDAILALEDNDEAIKKALLLKQQWRELGFTYYKEDKKLWSKLQQGIDKLFEKKRAITEAFKQELEAHAQQAQSIIDSINSITKEDDEIVEKSHSDFKQYLEDFSQIGKLPKARTKGIIQSLDQAKRAYFKRVDAIASKAIFKDLEKIRSVASHCRKIENAIVQSDSNSQNEALASIDEYTSIPEVLNERVNFLKSATAADLTAHSKESLSKAEEFMLTLEIMADVDSPESSRDTRTRLQLSMLEQGFQAALDQDQKISKYIQTETSLHQIAGIEMSDWDALVGRLEKIKKKLRVH